MIVIRLIVALTCYGLATSSVSSAAEQAKKSRDLLQPLQVLIGTWKASGSPEGTREEKQKGHWSEIVDCNWRFKGGEANIELTFEKGKFFKHGEIHPGKEAGTFSLTLENVSKEKLEFQGTLKEKSLTFERTDSSSKETQRLVFGLLHDNRITYRWETKASEKTFFTKQYTVGATKEGVPFAEIGLSDRECVVSGGLGTSTVTFEGKTYWVCCSGCRDEFKENPEKYVVAFEKKRAELKKEKK